MSEYFTVKVTSCKDCPYKVCYSYGSDCKFNSSDKPIYNVKSIPKNCIVRTNDNSILRSDDKRFE